MELSQKGELETNPFSFWNVTVSLLDSLAWQWTVLLIESEGFDPHVGNTDLD